jgi:hypothetical protein
VPTLSVLLGELTAIDCSGDPLLQAGVGPVHIILLPPPQAKRKTQARIAMVVAFIWTRPYASGAKPFYLESSPRFYNKTAADQKVCSKLLDLQVFF